MAKFRQREQGLLVGCFSLARDREV